MAFPATARWIGLGRALCESNSLPPIAAWAKSCGPVGGFAPFKSPRPIRSLLRRMLQDPGSALARFEGGVMTVNGHEDWFRGVTCEMANRKVSEKKSQSWAAWAGGKACLSPRAAAGSRESPSWNTERRGKTPRKSLKQQAARS